MSFSPYTGAEPSTAAGSFQATSMPFSSGMRMVQSPSIWTWQARRSPRASASSGSFFRPP